MVAVAPVNEISCSPGAATVCAARDPDCGAGLADTQFQLSPPSEAASAPRGRESSIQICVGLFAWNLFSANARRPSGHSISASTHWSPLLTGVTAYVEPKAGCWSRASQTIRAPARSSPGTLTLSVSSLFRRATVPGTVMTAEGALQEPPELEVSVARNAVAMKPRAW